MKFAFVLASIQSAWSCPSTEPGGHTRSVCGNPSSRLIPHPRNSNEQWGEWKLAYNIESKSFKLYCDGVAAYGRGYDDNDWHVAGIKSTGAGPGGCYWQFFPFSEDVHHITAAGFSDKGCYCSTLSCKDGQPIHWDNNLRKPVCPEHTPATPTKLEICMELIFGTDGTSTCDFDKKEKKWIGSTSSSQIDKSHKESISAEVSMKMSTDEVFAKMELDTSLKSAFANAYASTFKQSSFEKTEKEFSMHIECNKPAYWYRVTSRVYTTGGGSSVGGNVGTIDLFGDSQMVLGHAAPPCQSFPVSGAVAPLDLSAKVDNTAGQCFADYRVDCGFAGISSNQCTGYGCCYMKVSSGLSCTLPSQCTDSGAINNPTDCGWSGITRDQCSQRGCCYSKGAAKGGLSCWYSNSMMNSTAMMV